MTEPVSSGGAWAPERVGALALRFGPAALFVGLAIAAYASGVVQNINLDELSLRRLTLEEFVAVKPVISALGYVALFTAAVAISLPLALILCLTGGFLFGALEAGALASIASTFGGTLMFLVSRTAIGDLLVRLAGPRIAKLREEAANDAFALILTIRLIPMMPFWLINVGAAVIGVPLRTFFLATAVGVAPSCFIYASLGSGLGSLFDQGVKPSGALLLEPRVIVPLAALCLLGVLPLGWRMLRARRGRTDA